MPVYHRADLTTGSCRCAGPAVIAEDETTDHRASGLRRRARSAPSLRPGRSCWRGCDHEHATDPLRRIRPAGDVEPPDLGRRGAGADPDAHRASARRRARPGDLSAGVFDTRRRACWRRPSPARRATSTRWRASVGHLLAKFPLEDDEAEGDVFITNDPWKGTGHLQRHRHRHADLPARQAGRRCSPAPATSSISAAAASSADAQQVYEEGLYIPITKMRRRGQGQRSG